MATERESYQYQRALSADQGVLSVLSIRVFYQLSGRGPTPIRGSFQSECLISGVLSGCPISAGGRLSAIRVSYQVLSVYPIRLSGRVSYQDVLSGCRIRVPYQALSGGRISAIRVSYQVRSVYPIRLSGCLITYQDVLSGCHTRVPYQGVVSVLSGCPISLPVVLSVYPIRISGCLISGCPIRVSYQGALSECKRRSSVAILSQAPSCLK